jgi:hypothetical protein
MSIADVILWHIEQCFEAIACNEPKQAEIHNQMAKVLLERLGA